MERKLANRLPVYGVEGDCILSRKGDFTVAYRVTKPQIFTLSATEYESLHQAFAKAIRVLPAHSILHLQDWYIKEEHKLTRSPNPPDQIEHTKTYRYLHLAKDFKLRKFQSGPKPQFWVALCARLHIILIFSHYLLLKSEPNH